MRTVTLPNGYVYENVPKDITNAQILDRALKDGRITTTEFKDKVENLKDYSSVLSKYEPKPEKETQGDINTRRLMDVVGPVAQFGGRVFDETTNLIGDIPVVGGGTKAFIRGAGRGIGNIVEGTSQALYDVGGQITGNDTSRQLANIKEFRDTGEQGIAQDRADYPGLTSAGQFAGNVAPFLAVPTSIPGLLAGGATMGATQYQENEDQQSRNNNRAVSTALYPAIGLLTAGTAAVGMKSSGMAMQGLRNTVADVQRAGVTKAALSTAARAKNLVDELLPEKSIKRKAVELAGKGALALSTGGASIATPIITKSAMGKAIIDPVKKQVSKALANEQSAIKGINYEASPMSKMFIESGSNQAPYTSYSINELLGGDQ